MSAEVIHLHPETGEVVERCPGCEEREEIIAGLDRSIGKLERQIRAMQRDREDERKNDPQRALILGLIERWKVATGHPRAKNSDDRFDVIKARLREGYTIEQLELAIDGIGAYPYVSTNGRSRTGKPSQRHDRLGIALGGGEDVERFANMGYQARKERMAAVAA